MERTKGYSVKDDFIAVGKVLTEKVLDVVRLSEKGHNVVHELFFY